jgi:poly-gamma-glutamate capsule biosynthesis protein CapA/YwtB (metallophosphatase superfamily)
MCPERTPTPAGFEPATFSLEDRHKTISSGGGIQGKLGNTEWTTAKVSKVKGGRRSLAMKLILMGDINLMDVQTPAEPFRKIFDELHAADVVFGNLECCLHLPASRYSDANEGFFADPVVGGEALKLACIHAVGIANNVNYGAASIAASIARLDEVGVLHTGAGPNLTVARAPAVVERNGLRVGFLQRSSVYWPTDHEAHDDAPGIAVLRGHTAYHVPVGRLDSGIPPANRPGIPPVVITWADPAHLADFCNDIAALRPKVDILVASCHWGLGREPLQYMTEIGRAAIGAGADVVMGHGPHYSLPIELYKGRPIYYGLGNLCFKTGHLGRKHDNWIGMVAEVSFENGKCGADNFRFVRHNVDYETIFRGPGDETEVLADLIVRSKARGATLTAEDDRVRIAP